MRGPVRGDSVVNFRDLLIRQRVGHNNVAVFREELERLIHAFSPSAFRHSSRDALAGRAESDPSGTLSSTKPDPVVAEGIATADN